MLGSVLVTLHIEPLVVRGLGLRGCGQGLDSDITVGTLDAATVVQLLRAIYLKAKVLTMMMTDELLSGGRFRGGGDEVCLYVCGCMCG